jgi:hypothetical protein
MRTARTLLLLAAVVIPGAGLAQPAPPDVDLSNVLNVGDAVRVEDAAGQTWKGTVTRLAATELEMAVDGTRTMVRTADLREVAVAGDSLVNGTLIGFGAGGALGLAMGSFSGEYRAEDAVAGLLIFGGVGAGLGLGVDALIRGERVVYRRAPTAQLLPFLTRGGYALAARIRW